MHVSNSRSREGAIVREVMASCSINLSSSSALSWLALRSATDAPFSNVP
jgi:hypothetical protein